jgi:hypothetical protein
MTRRKKTAQITVRIDSSLKDAAERASAKDHRSLGSLIERLLVKHLRTRGLFNVPQRQSKEAARTTLKLALVRWTQLATVRCQPRNEKPGNNDYFTVQRNSAASAATSQSR